jgi:hypothetical protein
MWLEYAALASNNEVGLCKGPLECLLSGPRPFLAYTADGGNIRKKVYLYQ